MIDAIDSVFRQVSHDQPDLSFGLRLWDGSERVYGAGVPIFHLELGSPEAVARVASGGSLGFAEAFMDGSLKVEGDLQQLLALRTHPAVKNLHLSAKDKATFAASYLRHRNVAKRARQNVQHHYDLGNHFYRLWLDESLTYSCAYWADGIVTLDQAQDAKHEHICRKLMLRPGDRLVDVGCGWGAMLSYAARRYGVEGVGYTLSTEQQEYANERLRAEGLYPKVRVELEDYREATGSFNKFVSIGMFEHVGKEFYRTFFDKVAGLLEPAALGVLHTIGADQVSDVDPFTQKYIFPGGYIPTMAQITEPLGKAGFVMTDFENLRPHYARTLDAWAERFEVHADEVEKKLGAQFVRMWRLYLNSASASFKTGVIELFQITFTKGIRDLPWTRGYLYGAQTPDR
jgi:cyclopropane-fatty-acyl-phospholipid synthase